VGGQIPAAQKPGLNFSPAALAYNEIYFGIIPNAMILKITKKYITLWVL